MPSGLKESLKEITKQDNIVENESMSKHTTFKAGGKAALYVSPSDGDELAAVVKRCEDAAAPYFILGAGSNVLVRGGGFDGVIISTKNINAVRLADDGTISAQCGATLAKIAAFAAERCLAGFEFASGIPGTIGGAVYMNAGAYGGEIKDVFVKADVLSPSAKKTLTVGEMDFSYRHSVIQQEKYIVLNVFLTLKPGDKDAIKLRMGELNAKRAEKQPINLPSAGSAFKRPPNGFAARLIEDAGLKGFSIGGAQVSPKHAGFIVNTGGASAEDILNLAEHVRQTVFERFGVTLEREFIVL